MTNVNLTWEVAGNPENFTVYRSSQQIDPENLPQPIAVEVPSTEYIDTTAEENKTYFYMVASVKGSVSKLSEQIRVYTSQLWFKSEVVTSAVSNQASIFHSLVGTAIVSDMGNPISGSSKFTGGVLAPNGKIYCIPSGSSQVYALDPVTNTSSALPFVLQTNSNPKFCGGVLAPDSKIYSAPYADTNGILVIDPATGEVKYDKFGADFSGSYKFYGCVLANNGKIYGVPYNSTDILVIDPANSFAYRTPMGLTLSGSTKWNGGVLAPNGKIYCIQRNSSLILVINPETDTAYTIASPVTGTGLFSGGVLGADGKIYCIPWNYSGVLIINPSNDSLEAVTFANYGFTPSGATTSRYDGGVLGSDGKIYFIPHQATAVAVLDPLEPVLTNRMKNLDSFGNPITGVYKFSGGVSAPNGKIYGIPFNSNSVLQISMNAGVSPLDGRILRSPHYNKY